MRFVRDVMTWVCGVLWLMFRTAVVYVVSLLVVLIGLVVAGVMSEWSQAVMAMGALFVGPFFIWAVTGLAFEFGWDRTFHRWFLRRFNNPDTSVWVINWAANRTFWVAQMSAVDHPNCPPETLRMLANSEEHTALIARHDNTPDDVLLRFVNNYPGCWKALVGRSVFTVALAEELRKQPLCELDSEQFCRNPNVPEQVLVNYAQELLSSSPISDLHQHLLKALAANPSLPDRMRVLLTVGQRQTA